MELNKQHKMLEQVEAKVNEKKTASAETGMMGFYTNFLSKTMQGVEAHNK